LTRRILTGVFVFLLSSQSDASTIFSFNGLGDPVTRMDIRAQGMGGAGRALITRQNFSSANPALLAGFRTTGFSMQYDVQRRSVADGFAKRTMTDGDIGAFQVRIPWGGNVIGIGAEPITSVNFGVIDSIGTGPQSYSLSVEGSGGIQALSLGLGRHFWKGLYAGARLDLVVMGTITETYIKAYEDPRFVFEQVFQDPTTGLLFSNNIPLDADDRIIRSYRGYIPAFGAVYAINEGQFSVGLSVQLERSITQRRRLSNVSVDPSSVQGDPQDLGNFGVSVIASDIEEDSETKIKMPYIIGGGIGITSQSFKWMAALDAEMAFWGRTGNGLHDALDLGGGIRYMTGDPDLRTRGFKIELLAGVRYRTLYFKTPSGSQVSEVAGSFGFSLPFRSGSGSFRYVMQVGRRGNVAKNGASERFIMQTFSFTGFLR